MVAAVADHHSPIALYERPGAVITDARASLPPAGDLYTPAHYWLFEEGPGIWRVGFTKFATRMLGDIVEYDFGVTQGDQITLGQRLARSKASRP